MKVLSFLAALLLNLPNLQASPQAAATPSSSSAQAITLLTQSAAKLTGNVTLSDVTLVGTARRIAGSDDESGTAVLKALATGASRMDLTLPGGNRSEVISSSSAEPLGVWSGPDGVSHPIAYHNLLTAPAWFFPVFPIATGLSSGYVATYIGHETRNGQAVEHLTISQAPTTPAPPGALSLKHLSQLDFFLDSTTFLPAAITFNIHPDDNALLDIPVEIGFSNYTAVKGAQIPFHVEKFINNSLALDVQLDSAVLNSGLSGTAFQVQ
jgi:hypothetical protein